MSQACAVCACVALLQVYSLAYYEAALTAAADQRPPLLLRGASTSGGAGEAAGAASEGEEAALFGAGDAGDALSELEYRGGVSIPKVFHQSWRDDGFPKDLFNWRWQAVHRPSLLPSPSSLLPPPSSLRSPLRQHLSSLAASSSCNVSPRQWRRSSFCLRLTSSASSHPSRWTAAGRAGAAQPGVAADEAWTDATLRPPSQPPP